jgi:hypothetical protein
VADTHLEKTARQTQLADEIIQHIGRIFTGMAEGCGHQLLPLRVGGAVVVQHVRQHHASGVAVRHAARAAERVTDGVARARFRAAVAPC